MLDEVPAPTQTPPEAFTCLRSCPGGVGRVAVTGELDIATVPEARDALARAQDDSRVVVLDLQGLSFMDCSAVHLLIDTEQAMRRAGGRLVVVRADDAIDRLFGLVRLARRFEVIDPGTGADHGPAGGSAAEFERRYREVEAEGRSAAERLAPPARRRPLLTSMPPLDGATG